MPRLTCPSCGHRDELREPSTFEVRGQWPQGHWPVRKCTWCHAGLIVKPRFGFLFPFPKAKVIPPDTWAEMERRWHHAFGGSDDPTKNAECPVCGKMFPTAAGRDEHVAAKHA